MAVLLALTVGIIGMVLIWFIVWKAISINPKDNPHDSRH